MSYRTVVDLSPLQQGEDPVCAQVPLTETELAEAYVRAQADIAIMRPHQIKAEARRRILSVLPEWKQMNLIARQSELSRIQAGLMRDAQGAALPARALTPEEIAEEIAISAAWAWVTAIRTASDVLEQTMPDDVRADAHWPQPPA